MSGWWRVWILVAGVLAAGWLRADDWPQWRGPTRDGRWEETGIVDHFDGPRITSKWRAQVSNGYTSPTVAAGRVYLADRQTQPAAVERVLCFDAMTGSPVWQHAYPCQYRDFTYTDGPRAAITIDRGHAFSLGAMGHLVCLDAATGAVIWTRDLNTDYGIRMPPWGIAGAPLVDQRQVIVAIGGRDGAGIVALHRGSGKELWRALDDRATYSAPIFLAQAGKRLVVCWTAARVAGIDADSGQVCWQDAFPQASRVIGVAAPASDGQRLLISDFWEGSLMLRLLPDKPAVERLWYRKGASEQQTDSLHSLIVTPVFDGDSVFGVDSYGELRCLDARTGDRKWESLELLPRTRWGTVHLVRNADRYWLFTERGELAIARLSATGLQVLSRAFLIEPTKGQHPRGVCWSHPAFADRHVYIRNDRELVCANLTAPTGPATKP